MGAQRQGNQGGGSNHPNEPRDQRDNSPRDKPATQLDAKRAEYLAEQYGWTHGQLLVIRNQICLTATDEELEFFLATCKRTELDPFSRQIYFIKRKQKIENEWGDVSWVEVGRPEVAIDGLRALAERTGEYQGQGAMEWCADDGKWRDVWLAKTPPAAARCAIFRNGHREPMRAVALFDEYVPRFKGKGGGEERVPQMWQKMAANQLAKCSEALGFRKAFPRDMSGLYIAEEMEHTSAGAADFAAPSAAGKAEPKQLPSKPADATPIADLIAGWRDTIAKAKTRADLAPVGKVLSDAKHRGGADAEAITAALASEFQAAYSKLPPSAPAK